MYLLPSRANDTLLHCVWACVCAVRSRTCKAWQQVQVRTFSADSAGGPGPTTARRAGPGRITWINFRPLAKVAIFCGLSTVRTVRLAYANQVAAVRFSVVVVVASLIYSIVMCVCVCVYEYIKVNVRKPCACGGYATFRLSLGTWQHFFLPPRSAATQTTNGEWSYSAASDVCNSVFLLLFVCRYLYALESRVTSACCRSLRVKLCTYICCGFPGCGGFCCCCVRVLCVGICGGAVLSNTVGVARKWIIWGRSYHDASSTLQPTNPFYYRPE